MPRTRLFYALIGALFAAVLAVATAPAAHAEAWRNLNPLAKRQPVRLASEGVSVELVPQIETHEADGETFEQASVRIAELENTLSQAVSANGGLRDECLNETLFAFLAHAPFVLAARRNEYCTAKPHSKLCGRTPVEIVGQRASGMPPTHCHPIKQPS